jgi:two-component system nitrogen regulation response regulator NtrX
MGKVGAREAEMPAESRRIDLLIVDDDEDVQAIQKGFFEMSGICVTSASNAKEALDICKEENFDVILTDLIMPEMDGLELLRRLNEIKFKAEVIIFTGYGTVETAIEAMKNGAFSYMLKPTKVNRLLIEVEKAAQTARLKYENFLLKHSDVNKGPMFYQFISKKMENAMSELEIAAQSDSAILLLGESGVGKEVAANFVHSKSKRATDAFIKVHCASLSPGLLESELFGHEKGAFTGATADRKGRFELAKGGTIFLDEISTVSLETQIKLLRVLQEKKFERVGGSTTLSVDFRLITASNDDLQKLIKDGKFRRDLYYRIGVIPIMIPPLREMKEDIPRLARFFVDNFCASMGKQHIKLSDASMEDLLRYSWPGNIRELQNVIERAVVLDRNGVIDRDDIPGDLVGRNDSVKTDEEAFPNVILKEAMNRYERDFLVNVLEKNDYNVTRSAKTLNISRRNLQQKITKYSLKL